MCLWEGRTLKEEGVHGVELLGLALGKGDGLERPTEEHEGVDEPDDPGFLEPLDPAPFSSLGALEASLHDLHVVHIGVVAHKQHTAWPP